MAHSASFLIANLTNPQPLPSGHLACLSADHYEPGGFTHVFNGSKWQEDRLKQVWRDSPDEPTNKDSSVTRLVGVSRVWKRSKAFLLTGLAAALEELDSHVTMIRITGVQLPEPIHLAGRNGFSDVHTVEVFEPRGAGL